MVDFFLLVFFIIFDESPLLMVSQLAAGAGVVVD